ncbi:MAG: hypothetical protein LBQ66_04545 [Planctomycetaceae bacterium]|nr:hypothetical protein [Planctomycetaceae bacterium]
MSIRVPILFWLLPFQGEELLGAIFHRALPCAMGLLPRWCVLVLSVRVGDPVVCLRRRYSPKKPGGRLPTLHLPTRFGVQFKLVRCYYAQRRAGRPRSSPSPLRGNCQLSPTLVVCYTDACFAPLFSSCFARRKHYSPRKPSGRLSTLRCRLAVGCPPYVCQHVLAFRSNLFGSITHRGGRDARVPVRAASRQTYVVQQGRDARVPVRAASRQTYVVQQGRDARVPVRAASRRTYVV